jgi:dTDP-4-amino-4,6-dideoxygalactose transaminase
MIPLSRPHVDDDVKTAVLRALDSRPAILGEECRAFEAEFAAYVGTDHAVLTASGTAALVLAMRALDLPAGGEVLVPAHTAFPTVEAILIAGGRPVFVDIDETFTVDPADAAHKWTSRTVGLLPVHLYGHPADLEPLLELAGARGLWLLEDACQAHGALYRGQRVGGFGRAGCFSFYPSKNLTVLGDGGVIVTNEAELAARCRRLRDHGRSHKDIHQEVGDNLRFNEVQAAVGRVLLKRLDAGNTRRRSIAARYARALGQLPILLPRDADWAESVYHLFVIRTALRNALRAFLSGQGIETGIHYPVPCHRQPAVQHLPWVSLLQTERVVEEILSLPIYPDLDDASVDAVAAAIREFFAG